MPSKAERMYKSQPVQLSGFENAVQHRDGSIAIVDRHGSHHTINRQLRQHLTQFLVSRRELRQQRRRKLLVRLSLFCLALSLALALLVLRPSTLL